MKHLYIASWKMNLSFNESITFCKNNHDALQQLALHNTIVICPSFVALAAIAEIFKDTNVHIGAQNCSEYATGAYTGEVSALSLAQAGATYCIVGHSERRIYFHETPNIIIKKIDLLYQNNITPIICIGETQEDFDKQQTQQRLTEQLEPYFAPSYAESFGGHGKATKGRPIIIAYEPIWSIGTGIIPEQKQLTTTFEWLTEYTHSQLPNHNIQLLYGGSVTQDNIAMLKKIPPINGFLIGGASTQFEQLKNIITQ